jgi:hypothetical protein
MSLKHVQLGFLVLLLSTSDAIAQRAVLQACKPDIGSVLGLGFYAYAQ